ncbi:energy-coupling factor transport system ATP-binding protein [Dethiosulfatibacter aminovorans DSM 17477]|uniref:Energy-coupling factor transport system ATP-binding protein n=1 Tax=Dethiosulfatibacter aminovorans DSM 17477 TaxID=1121476 RepID=A0A1M6L708_9FIRM|nr:energy-coupling factor transporter ATPase [Dethiosulfatibacter aminovorans]SHJ66960.1 energy-coupling factor transport system ATP-binding protein [Dethiosulfatibacter aminovorans DSM 17477]
MNPIIKIENVSFKYSEEDKTPALDNVSLNIEKGEFVAILGHNGSGKSTLAKLINSLLLPTEGDIIVKDMNTRDDDKLWEIRQTAGMVFQNPDNQLVATIVEEDVAFGPENQGVEPDMIRELVDRSLKAVDMYEYRKRPPHLLSGGQKQRIAIAGVLALNSDCIILDEPTAMLDPSGRSEVMETIKMLNKEEDKTILLITHYMDEAVQADRVVVMDGGKVQLQGTPKEVFKNIDQIKKFGLDVPQVTELAHNLRKEGISLPEDIIMIEELVEELCR